MLTKINRAKCLAAYPNFPQVVYNEETEDHDSFYPDTVGHYYLTLPAKTLTGHLNGLVKSLVKLTELMGYNHLIFLGDYKTAWRYQNNEYKPVQDALAYLVANKVGKRFNGALQVIKAELPVFIRHIFWLTRCNASLPYFHFSDLDQSIMGMVCKHGNIHLSILDEPMKQPIYDAIDETKFEYIPSGNSCENLFDKTSAIWNRQIVI